MADDSRGRPETEAESSPQVESPSSQEGEGQDAEPGIPIPEEFLAGVPSEQRQLIINAVRSVTQFAAPAFNPIFQRVTSEHVTSIIANVEKDNVREHDASTSQRRYQFAYFLLGTVFAVGLIVFFTVSDNRDLIAPIVTAVAGFLGGLAAGRHFRN